MTQKDLIKKVPETCDRCGATTGAIWHDGHGIETGPNSELWGPFLLCGKCDKECTDDATALTIAQFYRPIKCAEEMPKCQCCEEPWCEDCKMHYADCDCVGPDEEGYEYIEHKGKIYAKKVEEEMIDFLV